MSITSGGIDLSGMDPARPIGAVHATPAECGSRTAARRRGPAAADAQPASAMTGRRAGEPPTRRTPTCPAPTSRERTSAGSSTWPPTWTPSTGCSPLHDRPGGRTAAHDQRRGRAGAGRAEIRLPGAMARVHPGTHTSGQHRRRRTAADAGIDELFSTSPVAGPRMTCAPNATTSSRRRCPGPVPPAAGPAAGQRPKRPARLAMKVEITGSGDELTSWTLAADELPLAATDASLRVKPPASAGPICDGVLAALVEAAAARRAEAHPGRASPHDPGADGRGNDLVPRRRARGVGVTGFEAGSGARVRDYRHQGVQRRAHALGWCTSRPARQAGSSPTGTACSASGAPRGFEDGGADGRAIAAMMPRRAEAGQ